MQKGLADKWEFLETQKCTVNTYAVLYVKLSIHIEKYNMCILHWVLYMNTVYVCPLLTV